MKPPRIFVYMCPTTPSVLQRHSPVMAVSVDVHIHPVLAYARGGQPGRDRATEKPLSAHGRVERTGSPSPTLRVGTGISDTADGRRTREAGGDAALGRVAAHLGLPAGRRR